MIVRAKRKPRPAKPKDRFARNVEGEDAYEIQYEVQMEFCSAHRDFFRDNYILNEATWSAIENQLRQQGMAPPDKDSVKIVWSAAAGPDGLDDEGREMVAAFRGEKLRSPTPGRLSHNIVIP